MAKRFPIYSESFFSIRLVIIALLTCLLALPLTVTVFAEGGISYGETREDYLDAGDGDHDDTWTFFGRYGDEVIITARDIKGNWTLDTYLELYAPYGWKIAVDDDGASTGRGLDARLRFCCLQEDGEYRIVVSYAPGSSNNFGSYALTLERGASSGIEEQTCALQPRLQIGERAQNITDTLTRLRQGPSVRESRVGAIAAGEVVDVLDGPVFAYGYYWWHVRKGGTTGWTAESGDCEYWLVPDGSGAGIGSNLRYGEIVLGSLNDANYFGDHKFDALAGERIAITMNRISGNLDPAIRLYNSSALEMAYDDNSGTGNDALISDFRIPSDGEYTIHALRTGAGQSGTYELSLTLHAAPVEQAEPIFCGQTVTGEITDDDWQDFWHFEGLADQTVKISMWGAEGTGLESGLVLSGDGGFVLGRSSGIGNAFLQLTLPEAGSFTIEATRRAGASGASAGEYSLLMECAGAYVPPLDPELEAVSVGQLIERCLNVGDEYQEFQLRLTERETIISLRVTANQHDMVPGLTLFDNAGMELATDENVFGFNLAKLEIVSLGPGLYRISVWSVRRGGCYALEIVEGELAPVAYSDVDVVQPAWNEGEKPPIPEGTPPLILFERIGETGSEIADFLAGVCDILVTQAASEVGNAVMKNGGQEHLLSVDPIELTKLVMEHVAIEVTEGVDSAIVDEIRVMVVTAVENFVNQYEIDQTAAGQEAAELWEDTENIRLFVVLLRDLIVRINDTLATASSGPCSAFKVLLHHESLYTELTERVDELVNFWTEGGRCRIRSELEVPARNWPRTDAVIVARVDLRTGAEKVSGFEPKLLGTEPLFMAQLPGGPKFYAVGGYKGVDTPAGILEDAVNIAPLMLRLPARLFDVGKAFAPGAGLVWIRADLVNETGNCADFKNYPVHLVPYPPADELFPIGLFRTPPDVICPLAVTGWHRLFDSSVGGAILPDVAMVVDKAETADTVYLVEQRNYRTQMWFVTEVPNPQNVSFESVISRSDPAELKQLAVQFGRARGWLYGSEVSERIDCYAIEKS